MMTIVAHCNVRLKTSACLPCHSIKHTIYEHNAAKTTTYNTATNILCIVIAPIHVLRNCATNCYNIAVTITQLAHSQLGLQLPKQTIN